MYVNTAFVNLRKGDFYVCIVPPLGTRANHFSLTMQPKGCSNNTLCQTLLAVMVLSEEYNLRFAFCCSPLAGLGC